MASPRRARAAAESTAAAKAEHEVAREEVAEATGPKVVEFHDLELTLPDELPPTVLFDLAIMQGDDLALMRLLDTVLGRDQYLAVRAVFAHAGHALEAFAEELGGLAEKISGAYGLTSGE